MATKRSTTSSSSEASTSTSDAGTSSTGAPAPSAAATTRRPATTTRPAAPGAPAATTTTPGGPPVGIKLTQVASLSSPVAFAQAPNDDALYVAEQGGRVRAVRNGTVSAPVLDISGQISTGGEQGLLGLAFSTARAVMVVNYTDTSGDTHVDEYPFSGGQVTGGARQLLFLDQPYANHNGGHVVFGPDGLLYIGTGDGGSGGDPQNHAQNVNDRLGKMLRLDAAAPTPQAQIWMLGLRNPWRYSFDRATGDMWIGDVGQNAWEEVDFAPAGSSGQNWGWARREGKHAYNGGAPPAGNVDPIYEMPNGPNCAVTGGYTYRGSRLAGWGGVYFFGDYCVGKVLALTRSGGNASVRETGLSTSQLTSFGEDRNGELYVLSQSGPLYRIDRA